MDPVCIPLDLLVLALAAIDNRRQAGWATKARLVALIGRWPQGVAVGRDTLTFWLCARSKGHVGDLLHELVEERVFLLEAPAAGRRPATYRVNPKLEDWRNVPWRRDPRLVIATMFHDQQGPGDNETACGPVHAPGDNGGLLAWYMHQAARVPVAARYMHRATTGTPAARYMHRATTGTPAARYMHRATSDPAEGQSMDRATTSEPGSVVVPPGDGPRLSSSSWGPEEEERELRRIGERDAGCDAIRRRVGASFLNGGPRTRAVQLVDTYGLAAVLDAIRAEAPDGAQVPTYVDRLAGRLAASSHGVDLDTLVPEEPAVGAQAAREVRSYDFYEPDTSPAPTADERAQAAERTSAARQALADARARNTIIADNDGR